MNTQTITLTLGFAKNKIMHHKSIWYKCTFKLNYIIFDNDKDKVLIREHDDEEDFPRNL